MAAPQYRVLARSFIGNQLVGEGAVIEYTGNPGSNLDPLNAEAKKAKDAYDKERGFAPRTPPEEAPQTSILARPGEEAEAITRKPKARRFARGRRRASKATPRARKIMREKTGTDATASTEAHND